jgi:predicted AAA+ superfamily ATPase
MTYYHRSLEAAVKRYLRLFPVVGITGPRQSGKSTMLRKLLSRKYRYVTFDDLTAVEQFTSDPEQFMGVYSDRVIFDEVQRVPELFHYVKRIVDEKREAYGRFVMTGSSQFGFMRNASESLAGRIGLLSLLPLQCAEIPVSQRNASVFRGGYPELVRRAYAGWGEWYDSYVNTYLTRDVRDISAIGDMRDFRRCLRTLAVRVSQLLNMSDIARDIGVSVPTVKKWISILEASYILFLLPPYASNIGKRMVKSPKVYFYDTGLVSFLTGISNEEVFERGPMSGALFENYVIAEVMKRELHTRSGAELFFLRDSNGNEIDLIIGRGSRVQHVEIKSSHTFRPAMAKTLIAQAAEASDSMLVYRGKELEIGKGIPALNVFRYLGSKQNNEE